MTGESSNSARREPEIPSIALAQAKAIAGANADPNGASDEDPPASSGQQSNRSHLQHAIRGFREEKQR